MATIKYNKLVRDNIPEIINKFGNKAKYRVLSKEDFRQALKDKLVEEVNEFLAAETNGERIEELADIKEVITEIRKAFSLKNTDINHCRHCKLIEKGGFNKRYFLESVADKQPQTGEDKKKRGRPRKTREIKVGDKVIVKRLGNYRYGYVSNIVNFIQNVCMVDSVDNDLIGVCKEDMKYYFGKDELELVEE